jgi:hypothetical protein
MSLAFLTYAGVLRFSPCITGEFMGNAPSLKIVFSKPLRRGFEKTVVWLRYWEH